MDMTHLAPFLEALHRGHAEGLDQHMSDSVTLRSPILADPVCGKPAVHAILAVLIKATDRFEVTDMVESERRAIVFVTIGSGDVMVDGVDDMHVDADGLVSGMTIQWRPLSAIVAMQQRIAPLLGFPAMTLVEA